MDLPDAPGPPRSSRKGLWITIGIHAALFAAAYFITLPMPAGAPAKMATPAAVYDDFQMPVRMAVPQALSKKPALKIVAKSIPFGSSQKMPFTATDHTSGLEWPPLTPIFASSILAAPSAETPIKATAQKVSKPKAKKGRRVKK